MSTSSDQRDASTDAVARPPRWRRALLVSAVVGLAVVLAPTVAVQAMSASGRHVRSEDVPARDVTLVLGAGVLPSGAPTDFLKERLDLAADLYQQGRTKVLLLSGDNSEQHYNEPEAMRRYLVNRRNIPADRIVLDYAGFDTRHSCVRAKKVFGVDSLTIVTQQYHVPRALAACRMAGVDAQGLGGIAMRNKWPWNWWTGVLREVPGNVKLVLEQAFNRPVLLGPHETGVEDALAKA